jgi:hypothetical protein
MSILQCRNIREIFVDFFMKLGQREIYGFFFTDPECRKRVHIKALARILDHFAKRED